MIVFDLPPPISVNVTRRIDYAGHAKALAWRKQADKLILMQKRGPLPKITGEYELLITVSSASKLDLPNCEKIVTDYLVSLGIVQGDSPRYLRRLVMEFGEAPEGTRITVKAFMPNIVPTT